MKIGLDLRRLTDTGIGRLSRNLTRALLAQDTGHQFVVILHEPRDAEILGVTSERLRLVFRPARKFSPHELSSAWKVANSERLDVLHVPHQFHMPFSRQWATVVSVLDLSNVLYPTSQKARVFGRSFKVFLKLACARAQAVMTLSSAARESIIQHLRTPKSRITVVHCAVDPSLSVEPDRALIEDFRRRMHLARRTVLYVGMWKPHKNVATLIRAFGQMLHKYGDELDLVLVGKPDPEHEAAVKQAAAQAGIQSHLKLTGRVSDSDLRLAYNMADVLVHPSLNEGFGLTVLEAMACGTPVVASNIPAHQEIAGDAAMLVDAISVEEFAAAMHRVLNDQSLAMSLRSHGFQNVKRYSWERAAKETLALYEFSLENLHRR